VEKSRLTNDDVIFLGKNELPENNQIFHWMDSKMPKHLVMSFFYK